MTQLVEEGVLIRESSKYSINKQWVLDVKKTLDVLQDDLTRKKVSPTSVESIKGEISVFTFNSLNELSDIVNRKLEIKLTVIRDEGMANHINHSILSQIG